jgi:phosphoglycolate phosphatase-like HAD superfamily hydrolase
MIRWPLPIPPIAPDVKSSDESESNISPNVLEYDGESEGQRRARERRNKLKEGRRCHARQRKEAHDTYKMELAEYCKRRSEKEAKERRVTRIHEAPYDKIREALEELKAISHPNEEQEQL